MASQRRQPASGSNCNGRLGQGDSFHLIKKVDSATIDLVLTSPPYWGLRSYGLDHNDDILSQWEALGCSRSRVPPWDWYKKQGGVLGLEPFPDWYIAHLVEFFGRARRVLKPTGNLWVNLGDTYFARWSSIRDNGRQGIRDGRERRRTPSGGYLHDKQLLLIPARFAIAMQDAGWILRNDLIWAKPHPLPRPESDRLRLSHEHWFHFVLRRRSGRPSYYYDLEQCEAHAMDVIKHPTSNGGSGHTATFPMELIERRILSSSPRGGIVLDPFCGTGVTVVTAMKLGREGVGFELSRRNAQLAAKCIRAAARARVTGEDRK
ncbi:MAG TPA: site-specific DNA-methyltransferase [Thermoanaerobaculia bacterium]|nr:site-specific DNA-methyltransferase [Thermoanaerobaculia bacterium]